MTRVKCKVLWKSGSSSNSFRGTDFYADLILGGKEKVSTYHHNISCFVDPSMKSYRIRSKLAASSMSNTAADRFALFFLLYRCVVGSVQYVQKRCHIASGFVSSETPSPLVSWSTGSQTACFFCDMAHHNSMAMKRTGPFKACSDPRSNIHSMLRTQNADKGWHLALLGFPYLTIVCLWEWSHGKKMPERACEKVLQLGLGLAKGDKSDERDFGFVLPQFPISLTFSPSPFSSLSWLHRWYHSQRKARSAAKSIQNIPKSPNAKPSEAGGSMPTLLTDLPKSNGLVAAIVDTFACACWVDVIGLR